MTGKLIDGFISHGLAVFEDQKRTRYASAAWSVDSPVFENASLEFLNQIESEFRALERMLPSGSRLQVNWSVESNCRRTLLKYYDQTNSGKLTPFAKRQRHGIFTRLSKRMQAGELRFQKVTLFYSVKLSSKGDLDEILKAESRAFDALENQARGCFERLGGGLTRLSGPAIFEEMFRFCNPSQTEVEDIKALYDPTRSLMANCLTGEGNAVVSTDAGFFMDGKYFGFLILKSLPQATYSGMIGHHLTSLPIRDFGLTVTSIPLDTIREIEKEESEIERLRKGIRSGTQERAATTLNQKIQRVQRLAANEGIPFQVQIIIRAWDATQEGLQTKLGILKSAVTRMQLAKSYSPVYPPTARYYWRASFPGWCWDACRDFVHPIEDAPLSNLLPISGSPSLVKAEALYDGANENVIGISTFDGEVGSESPQHALVVGMTGSGKSCFLINLLTQTSPGYSYTVIIDNGLSYETFARTADSHSEPVIIKPGGGVTINYLDTLRAPLDPDFLVGVVATAHALAGRSPDQDKDRRRRAILSDCISKFFCDFAQDWLRHDPTRRLEVRRYAAVLKWFRAPGGALSLVEKHHAFHAWAKENEASAEQCFRNVTEADMRDVSLETVVALSYAFIPPNEAPIHSDFQRWLELAAMGDSVDREEIGILATFLKIWCVDGGTYGAIVDGINTVNFAGELLHLELGQIPESAPDLLAVTALLLTNQIRNVIKQLPRNLRKRLVIEELGTFMKIPGGAALLSEFCQTMRKYNCWVVCATQQLDALDGCSQSVLGNIRLAFFFRQISPHAVDAIASAFQLPESAVQTLSRFPNPSPERGAAFLCWRSGDLRPEIVTGFHVASPEMLFVSSSGGEHFEKRRELLSRYDSVEEGIIAEAEKSIR